MKNQKSASSQPVVSTPSLKAKAKVKKPTDAAAPAASSPKAAKAQASPAPSTPAQPEAKEAKASKASKYVSAEPVLGRRMRVAEYQDYTFSINDRPDRQLTDEQLCADWQKQFPAAVHFETFHVRGARRDFNAGLHSKAFPGKHESVPYSRGADGKAVKSPYTRAVKPTADKATGAAPQASDTAKVDAAKKAAQAVVKGKKVAA